jgi:hypothetical protein
MAFNWENYKELEWFASPRQRILDRVFQEAYESGEDGKNVENPFNDLPPEHGLNRDPDLLLGLKHSFDDGLRDGKQVRENREVRNLK